MVTEWKKTEHELPEIDGSYEVTNNPQLHDDEFNRHTGLAYYDGWGFKYCGIYYWPAYWRDPIFLKEKRYGKINK